MMTAAVLAPSLVFARTATDASAAGMSSPAALQLEVWVNGQLTDLVAAFTQAPDGDLTSTVAELRSLGLKVRGLGSENVNVSALPDVTYDYDAGQQRLDIQAKSAALLPHVLRLRKTRALHPVPSDIVQRKSLRDGLSVRAGRPQHRLLCRALAGVRWRAFG
jgi:outer membrane usher protein FimD/PapC